MLIVVCSGWILHDRLDIVSKHYTQSRKDRPVLHRECHGWWKVFLSIISHNTYLVLWGLLAPDKPADKDLREMLKKYFEPSKIVIAECFISITEHKDQKKASLTLWPVYRNCQCIANFWPDLRKGVPFQLHTFGNPYLPLWLRYSVPSWNSVTVYP